MSSSDDPDTLNTSDKCVSGERNRERERDSNVVCVLVMWNHIGPSPLHARGRPLFWLKKTNKTGYYTNSYRFKGKIWPSDNSWYKVRKIFNGISSGPTCWQFATVDHFQGLCTTNSDKISYWDHQRLQFSRVKEGKSRHKIAPWANKQPNRCFWSQQLYENYDLNE